MRAGAGMTLGATRPAMDRALYLSRVDIQGNGLPVALHLEIRLAVTAQAVGVRHLAVKYLADLMRLMAIDADRHLIRLGLPQLTLNNLLVDLLDPPVALAAGGGDVVAVDGRARVRMGQHMMSRVAIGAHRRHRQPLFEQSLAMDRLGIVGQDAVLWDLVSLRHRRPLFVAPAAHVRNVEFDHPRIGRSMRNDVVRTVTVPAAGRQLLSLGDRLTMQALAVDLGDIFMAGTAIDRRRLRFVRKLLDARQVGMASDAFHAGMDRGFEDGAVDEKRNLTVVPLHRKSGLSMAGKAIIGRLGRQAGRHCP